MEREREERDGGEQRERAKRANLVCEFVSISLSSLTYSSSPSHLYRVSLHFYPRRFAVFRTFTFVVAFVLEYLLPRSSLLIRSPLIRLPVFLLFSPRAHARQARGEDDKTPTVNDQGLLNILRPVDTSQGDNLTDDAEIEVVLHRFAWRNAAQIDKAGSGMCLSLRLPPPRLLVIPERTFYDPRSRVRTICDWAMEDTLARHSPPKSQTRSAPAPYTAQQHPPLQAQGPSPSPASRGGANAGTGIAPAQQQPQPAPQPVQHKRQPPEAHPRLQQRVTTYAEPTVRAGAQYYALRGVLSAAQAQAQSLHPPQHTQLLESALSPSPIGDAPVAPSVLRPCRRSPGRAIVRSCRRCCAVQRRVGSKELLRACAWAAAGAGVVWGADALQDPGVGLVPQCPAAGLRVDGRGV
ncbi:hypothetical protein C8R47DRAFT_1226008 [Mycena vitilis]|nr:hypothetical protein C8R47DRAFT_1226008 [Mycena vitilis]